MRKILLFTISIFLVFSLKAQLPDLPEILEEQIMQEHFDLTYNEQVQEFDKNENQYYRYVPRDGGTDTLFGYRWDDEFEEWVLKCRIVRTMNEEELPVTKLIQLLTFDSIWVDGLHYDYSYNDNNDLTEVVIMYWKPDAMVWENYFRMQRTYDDGFKLTNILTQWWSDNTQQWVDFHSKTFVYNGDQLESDTVKVYLDMMSEWMNFFYNSYAYDDSGTRISKTNHLWLAFMNDWSKNYRLMYYYDDSEENIVQVVGQNWDMFDQAWNDRNRYNYTYDDAGDMVQYVFEKKKLFDSVWVEKVKIDYTYDGMGNMIQYVWQYKPHFDTVWNNFKQVYFSYDENGNMIERIEQRWDEDVADWVNYSKWEMAIEYPAITGVYENNESEISATFKNPYMNGDVIHLSGVLNTRNFKLMVFDLTGKMVEKINVSGKTSAVLKNQLIPGLYLVILTNDKDFKLTQKMIVSD